MQPPTMNFQQFDDFLSAVPQVFVSSQLKRLRREELRTRRSSSMVELLWIDPISLYRSTPQAGGEMLEVRKNALGL